MPTRDITVRAEMNRFLELTVAKDVTTLTPVTCNQGCGSGGDLASWNCFLLGKARVKNIVKKLSCYYRLGSL